MTTLAILPTRHATRSEPQNEIRYRLQEDRDRFEEVRWPKGQHIDGRSVILKAFTFRNGCAEYVSNPYFRFARVARGTRVDAIPDIGLTEKQLATVCHARKTWPEAVGVMLPAGRDQDGNPVQRR
jgi:cytochrome c1